MIPVAALLPVLGSTAVKSVHTGQPPDAAAWASLSDELLRLVVTHESNVDASPARIEAKIDDIGRQDYRNSLNAAIETLRDADPSWRSPQDPGRLLGDARLSLNRAYAAASSPQAKANVKSITAITWLLSQSVPDAQRALDAGAEHGVQAYRLIALEQSPHADAWRRDRRYFLWKQPDFMRGLEARVNTWIAWFSDLQQMRQLLGVSAAQAPLPQLKDAYAFLLDRGPLLYDADARFGLISWDPSPPESFQLRPT